MAAWREQVTTETLFELIGRQQVVTDPMRRALEVHGPDARVEVVRRDTPFGVFVLRWEVVL